MNSVIMKNDLVILNAPGLSFEYLNVSILNRHTVLEKVRFEVTRSLLFHIINLFIYKYLRANNGQIFAGKAN